MPSNRALVGFGLLSFCLLCKDSLPEDQRPLRPPDSFVCGTTFERNRDALARSRYRASYLRRIAESSGKRTLSEVQPLSLQQDVGDVAVIEDDGTLITNVNPFDLSGKSLRFVPPPSSSTSYQILSDTSTFDATGGTAIKLADDDTFTLQLQAPFTFYGTTYSSVQINSDGNLTFQQGDVATTERDLGRFSSGPPRIGPLFTDLNPEQGGTISYRFDNNGLDTDGVLVVWNAVPPWTNGTPSQFNSFSVKLLRNGSIVFTYGTVDADSAVAGISPGSSLAGITAADLSQHLPAGALAGTIAEVFSARMVVSETAVARKFLQNHPDVFDHLILFLGFSYNLGSGAFAYELPVKNEVLGIGDILPGNPTFDFSTEYGSNGRLRSFVNMGTLTGTGRYPSDPLERIPTVGTNNTVSIMGQESGHRWEAFAQLRDGSVNSTEILGRDLAHWSFFLNSEGSVMEGNKIQDFGADKGASRFLTVGATSTYSGLDQYIMGLLPGDLVPPMFLVVNKYGTYRDASSAPALNVSFGGDRKDFTIDDVINAIGPRAPSTYQAPKVFRQAFVYLVPWGQAADPTEVNKVQRIRDAWVQFFNDQTGKRGWIVTDLQDSPATTAATVRFPSFQANAGRYTGVAMANWSDRPADVLFTAYDNSGAPMAAPAGIINPRILTVPPKGQIADVAERIFGLNLDDPHNGWIEARSAGSQVTGFFLDGDSAQTTLSGAIAGRPPLTLQYFSRAQVSSASRPGNTYRNLINVVNPDTSAAAQLAFALYDESGKLIGAASRTVPPMGRMAEDLTSLIPGQQAPRLSGYLVLRSDIGVIGYQSIDTGVTLYSLPALPGSTGTQLYSAQFASGLAGTTRYFSQLNLVNTGTQTRNIRVTLIGNTGTPVSGIRNPVDLALAAGQQYQARGEDLFQLVRADQSPTLVDGSIVATSDGPGIIGDLLFGDPITGRFMAGLPLDGNPVSDLVLSQVAEGSAGGGKPYFTGIAIYNPGSNDVNVTIDVYSGQGSKTGSAAFVLASGNRLSRTLPELVPAIQSQLGGFIRVGVSGGVVISYGLFGTMNLDFLAAVPAQPMSP